MPGVNEVLGPLPEEYAAVPLFAGQERSPLRLCAVVRKTADPVSGHLVLLRDHFDSRVILGAVTDAASTVHQYVELHVQTTQSVRDTCGERFGLTNKSLDDRWIGDFQAWTAADAATVLSTGYESQHPPPILIDPAALKPIDLPGAPDGTWQLCEDDALLRQVGLPPYGTSLDRYLYQPKLGKDGPFVAIHPASPSGTSTIALADLLGQAPAIAVNAEAGLLLVRPYHPLSFEEFMEVLRSGSWDGVRHGRSILQWSGPGESNGESTGEPLGGQQLLSRYGRAGKAIERFYLTICALAGAAAAVRDVVRQSQRPCLNLGAESFRVGLSRSGPGLPLLWTARVALTQMGDALPLHVEGTDTQYFLRAASGTSTIFQPTIAQTASSGRGGFRIRQILPEGRGVVVEGTFTPRERLQAARNDLLRLRIGLAAGRVDLYARLQPDMALAGGEWRLRSLPQSIDEPLAGQLRAAAGTPLANIEFEHIPFQSTPCDLYGLAVLAIHALLVKPGGASAVALDEIMSLARQAAIDAENGLPLPQRIAAIFGKDNRWGESLGPQSLWGESAVGDPRRWLFPAELWWETLSAIVRLLPGVGPDSYSTDFGDAPPGAIHRVFDGHLADMDALINKSRSLVLGDWQLNREVHGIIGWFLQPPKDTKKPAPPAPAARQPAGR